MLNGYLSAILLGAGASKPCGVPTTYEMSEQFLNTHPHPNLISLTKDRDIDVEELIRIVKNAKSIQTNHALKLLKSPTKNVMSQIEEISKEFSLIENNIYKHIRTKCLEPNESKSYEIYKPIIEISKYTPLLIFSTNYDTIVENVCKKLELAFDDGFSLLPFDDYPVFDPESFGCNSIQLYKLHGSISWWTDSARQKIFRMSLELSGAKNINELMIYPAQQQDIYNYPFNILQSIFITTLNRISELIVVGHKFGDENILSSLKATLKTRKDFRLKIVNPSATEIKKSVFKDDEQVIAINESIEEWVKKLDVYKDKVIEFNKKLEEEKHDNQIVNRTHIIEDYKRSKEFDLEIKKAVESYKSKHAGGSKNTIEPTLNPSTIVSTSSDRSVFPYTPPSIFDNSLKNKLKCSECGNEFNGLTLGIGSRRNLCFNCSFKKDMLKTSKCSKCGNEFHGILSGPALSGGLCPTCSFNEKFFRKSKCSRCGNEFDNILLGVGSRSDLCPLCSTNLFRGN